MSESLNVSTVLIIDDEPGIISLSQRLLDKAGFNTRGIADPRLCAEILEKERIDILLVDIRTPGMDGFQLIDMSRGLHPDLAVVVMTGFGTVDTALETLRRGADGLILNHSQGQNWYKASSAPSRKNNINRICCECKP